MQKTVQWYPGHMFKAKKELQAQLKNIDVIVEVIDARVAISSHNEMLEEITANKAKLIVISKYDMVEKNDINKIVENYERNGFTTICVNIKNGEDRKKIINKIEEVSKPITDKYLKKGIIKRIRIAVIGMPNVGKSTLINHLVGKKKVIVGNKPGVTKQQQWVVINDNLELMDTPGILVPKIEDVDSGYRLVLCQLVKDEVVRIEDVAIYLLTYLYENNQTQLFERYDIKNVNEFDIEDLYNQIAKNIGALLRGGEFDYDRVSFTLINDFRNLKFGKVSLER